MILLGELLQRPHLDAKHEIPWGNVHWLSFPLEGVHGIPKSLRSPILVDVYQTSHSPGYSQSLGLARSLLSGRRRWGSVKEVWGRWESVKEVCLDESAWSSPLLPPWRAPMTLHLLLGSSSLLSPWSGLLLQSPVWQINGLHSGTVSIS